MILSTWIRNWKQSIERRWALYQSQRRKAVARRQVSQPRLEALEDRFLLSAYTVTSAADDGSAGTLRYAINQANIAGSTITEIDFNIGAVGSKQTISLTSQLPALTASGVFINGLSQGGSGNTTRLITLSRTSAGSGSDGLLLQASNDIVSGLIIQNFAGNGVEIAGTANTVGGTASGAGNILSGNGSDSVRIDSSNLVLGKVIGINTGGTTQANSGNGVEIAGSSNTIGGTASGARNILSGNSKDGVLIDSSASGTLVQGNYVGINYVSAALGNGSNGVEIAGSNNTIGGSVSGTGNTIADNTSAGVLVRVGSGNTIRRDSIYANGSANTGPGITLVSGGNNNLGAPSITSDTVNGSTLTVTGNFTAPTANVGYVLEFFANPSSDAEGKIYLGSLTVTPTSTGTQNFTFSTTTTVTGTDPLITATLTDPSGDTSAISIPPSLHVLDLNTGETVPANVTLNTFSTWSENLVAQVSGATVSSYSWNVSQAPDLTSVSGTSTANLQGTWASFAGAARTDTISVTETLQSGSPLTLTMTFAVAGTASPAYSSTQPTSSSTWPTVITPDQITSGQAMQVAGPYAYIGEGDGSVQTSFSMPSSNPNTAPVSLDYNSTTANAQPIFLTEYQLPLGQAVPSTITAQLTFNNTALASVSYNTSGLNPGGIIQIALQANATALSTGRYLWSITVTNGSRPTTYSGSVDIVNQANSPYGAGWSLDNAEQLVSVSGGEMLVNPGGTSLYFASNGQGGYTTPVGDFSTLTVSGGVYTRPMPDGTKINFNSSGLQTSIIDTDGNTTTFNYHGSNLLTSITDMNGQQTTLAYNASNQLTSITDPANRTATLSYSGKELTSITDPGSNVWKYGYDSGNDLTALTDPNTHTTAFYYNSADRVSRVTQPDSTTEKLSAMQMNGWAAAGSTNVTAVLLTTGDQALFTDADNDVWTTGLDWLGFGLDTADIDPSGDASLNYIDANGLAWLSADALGRPTVDFSDSKGNVTEEVAPDDTTQQFQYNSFSEVTKYTDQEGHVTTDSYDSNGNLTQITDALNGITTFAYNSAGLVTSTTDPNRNTTTYAYNSLNELTSTTNALSGVTTYAYDNAGDLTSTTDARGFATTYSYNALDWMTCQTLPDTPGVYSTYTFSYDKVGNQTSATDPLNHTTADGYNAVDEQTTLTNTLNQTTTYSYDANGNQTSATNPLGQAATYGYNAANELTSMTDPLGDQTAYAYDAAGEQTSITDPMGNRTVYTYTPRGEVQTVLNLTPTGTLVSMVNNTYYSCGCPNSTTDVNIGASQNNSSLSGSFSGTIENADGTYEPISGGISGSIYGSSVSGSISGYFPDESGDGIPLDGSFSGTISNGVLSGTLSGSTDGGYGQSVSGSISGTYSNGILSASLSGLVIPNGTFSGNFSNIVGSTTSVQRNALHQVTSMTDAMGNTTSYSYDKDSNLTSVTDPNRNTTTYAYNALDTLTSVTNALNQTTSYGYDATGDLTSETDPLNQTTTYSYDGQGQLLTETAPNGGVTKYAYDLAGNLSSLTDPDNNTTTYTYDAANELVSTISPQAPNNPATYAYNAAGELTSTTDPDGRTITYGYDAAGRETAETWVGGNYTATYGYNADSELTSASDPNSTYTYTYNALGQVTSVDNAGTPGVPPVTLDYSYDSFGNRTSLTDSLGGSISYSYDGDNRPTSLGLSVNGTLDAQVTFGYDAGSRLTGMTETAPSVSGDTLKTSYSYDKADELTNITASDVSKSLTLANYTYGYNAGGELTSYQDNSGNSLTYGYDPNGELTSATGSLANQSYTFTYNYDLNGNRTSTSTDVNGSLTSASYTTVAGNELQNDGTYTYTYDSNGNTTSQTNLQTGSVTYYTWDYENRLTEVKEESSNGTVLNDEKFTYDVFGNRIAESLNGTPQLYTVYDGSNPYMDFNGSGQLTERYLTNPNALNQFYGQVAQNGTSETTEWFLTDNINSIRQVVGTSGSNNGSVLDAITYDPYGNILNQTSSANAPRFLYTGGAYDPTTGTYLDGAREDNSVDGRWLSQDPLGLSPDSNPYRYVNNNPVVDVDGTGLQGAPADSASTITITKVIGKETKMVPVRNAQGIVIADKIYQRTEIQTITYQKVVNPAWAAIYNEIMQKSRKIQADLAKASKLREQAKDYALKASIYGVFVATSQGCKELAKITPLKIVFWGYSAIAGSIGATLAYAAASANSMANSLETTAQILQSQLEQLEQQLAKTTQYLMSNETISTRWTDPVLVGINWISRDRR